MYKNMWSNIFKETMEYPDYTFEKHFGKSTPSFPPRPVIRDYLEGRWTKGSNTDLKQYIEFNTAVRFVKFCDDKNEFTVTVNNLNTGDTREEIFSHVIVASGIFSTPNIPEVNGIENFQGRILHSHDFRDAREFAGQKVLLIGAGFSGEDIALQLLKYGGERVLLSYKNIPKSYTCKLPDGIEERPMMERFDSQRAYFIDQSCADIDAVILTTGYKNYFPFLEGRFRICEETHLYPEGLYKAALYFQAGNNRLFYVGVQEPLVTFHKIEVIANWTVKFIMGQLKDEPKSQAEMEADADCWRKKVNAITCLSDVAHVEMDLIEHLTELGGYNKEILKIRLMILQLFRDRKETLGLAKYRDASYRNIHSDEMAPKQTPFMKNFDESIDGYVNCKLKI
ncbi:uncharacterized protein LOC123553170 [Mercenaria mercenaria]|uniref:uncharacterized protein LOC123553170 n=1 Tax=Mercenaria mercenaria TaxID=6596 RepID=UPI00234FA97B|nr:uncharacterized protein LOC123553170 [Mercenaria mercenaria]